jgi:hypothetical protein
VLFSALPGQIRHLKWWLTKVFVENVDIFRMYSEMGNNECTEKLLEFQDSGNPSVFITTPKVRGTGSKFYNSKSYSNYSGIFGIE